MNNKEHFKQEWARYDWSQWETLDSLISDDKFKDVSGIYRIKHSEYRRLIYIGESENINDRVKKLKSGIYSGRMPFSDPHTASPALWAIHDRFGGIFEISVAAPPNSKKKYTRKAIEAACIYIHRRDHADTVANFARMPAGYCKSKKKDTGIRGCLTDCDKHRSYKKGKEPVVTTGQGVMPRKSMGLQWSISAPLDDADSGLPSDGGVYRIWNKSNDEKLEYIGQTSSISRRLNNYRRGDKFDSSLIFSYHNLPDFYSFQRKQVEKDLIGAHFIVTDNPPREQFKGK